MATKKTILHVIDTLEKGGAEKMLVTVCNELTEYNNIVVTLWDKNVFKKELNCDGYISLHASRIKILSFFSAIKLRRVIKKYKPDIIHSHLFWSTLAARIVGTKKIPVINTIHTFPASSVDYKKGYMRTIDRLSYQLCKPVIIAVAKGALDEYFAMLNKKIRKAYAVYTFVDVKIFKQTGAPSSVDDTFRLISIGSLKVQKNQQYFIEAFKQLKNENIQLDIYGEGPLREMLQNGLNENRIKNIQLKGNVNNIQQLIGKYDLFVMPSIYEGFSLAVLEAMALNRPMLLSNIASFKEQCADTALYFDVNDPLDFVQKLKNILANKEQLKELGERAGQRVLNNFTLEHHMEQLRNIYITALKNPNSD